jgi:hypothetical protein
VKRYELGGVGGGGGGGTSNISTYINCSGITYLDIITSGNEVGGIEASPMAPTV